MSRIVLIDGENLLFALRDMIGGKKRAPREQVDNYDFKGLLSEILADELPKDILWFGARLRKYEHTEKLKLKTQEAIKSQAKHANHMRSQKINFIKVGYLRARETEVCKDCGRQEWKLVEKGVDVGMAVRMIQESNKKNEVIIVSADTDLLPAVKLAKKMGAKIMYVGYEHRPINALSQASNTTRIITKPLTKKYMSK